MWDCDRSFPWSMSFCNSWIKGANAKVPNVTTHQWFKRNACASMVLFSLYIANRFLRPYVDVPITGYFFKNYFNDLIGGFLFCSYVNTILIMNHKKPIVSGIRLFLLMIPVAVSWEYVFPLILTYSTSDWIDVFMYLLGTALYYLLICRGYHIDATKR